MKQHPKPKDGSGKQSYWAPRCEILLRRVAVLRRRRVIQRLCRVTESLRQPGLQ
jgi:hypothetical protein